MDDPLCRLVADYPVNLMEIRSWENLEWFHSDLRQVFGFLKYAQDKSQLKNFIDRNRDIFSAMPEDAYDFIGVMSHTGELKQLKTQIRVQGGGYDMCKAIDEMIRDGRNTGKAEGKAEGISVMNLLVRRLLQDNRQEELLRSTNDPDLQKRLLKEYSLDI